MARGQTPDTSIEAFYMSQEAQRMQDWPRARRLHWLLCRYRNGLTRYEIAQCLRIPHGSIGTIAADLIHKEIIKVEGSRENRYSKCKAQVLVAIKTFPVIYQADEYVNQKSTFLAFINNPEAVEQLSLSEAVFAKRILDDLIRRREKEMNNSPLRLMSGQRKEKSC